MVLLLQFLLSVGGWKQRTTVEPALLYSALRPVNAKPSFSEKYEDVCDESKTRLTVDS